MRHARTTFLVLAALTLAPLSSLLAQRRTTDGGGSGGSRPAPSGGGGGSVSSGGRSSGGSSGGGTVRSGGSSDGDRRSPSADRGSSPSGSPRASSGNTASGSNRPASGKIGALKRSARAARAGAGGVIVERGVWLGNCWDCNYWGWYHGGWGWYHGGWWYPSYGPYYGGRGEVTTTDEPEAGQGYQPYPYAENDGTGSTFVEQHSTVRPSFGAISGNFFSDVGSTTRAGQFAIEGAYRQIRGEVEYASYAEPVATGTDHMQTVRLGVGAQPRLGGKAYLVAGLAARGVFLDDGSDAWGPEGELGVQWLPRRPFGLNVTGRLAAMTWSGAVADYFALREVNTTGSLFVGRIELQAGWHWLKMGGNPAFAGPVFGSRIWF